MRKRTAKLVIPTGWRGSSKRAVENIPDIDPTFMRTLSAEENIVTLPWKWKQQESLKGCQHMMWSPQSGKHIGKNKHACIRELFSHSLSVSSALIGQTIWTVATDN